MSAAGYTVAVVGASGMVGQDLLDVLARSPLPVARLIAVGGPGGRVPTVSFAGQEQEVVALPVDVEPAILDEADLVFLCVPAKVAARLGPILAERGVATFDLSGATWPAAPLAAAAAPGRGLEERFATDRRLSLPLPVASALAALVAPLSELSLRVVSGVALQPAGCAGREGVEELSAQVLALFGGQDPPRRVFPEGLAFDLALPGGARKEGWHPLERLVALQAATLTGTSPQTFAVGIAWVPLFTGLGLHLHLRFREPDIGPIQLIEIWENAAPIVLSERFAGPRQLTGKGRLHVGPIAADPQGEGVHLWAAADNVRFGASANAVGLAVRLWKAGVL